MGCSQSHLCVATLSQKDAANALLERHQKQLQQASLKQSSVSSLKQSSSLLQSSVSSLKQRSVKLPPVRLFEADPQKAAQSATDKEEAVAAAAELLQRNQGLRHRDTYVRATLVSYGGSCRVFTAVNKHTNEPVAIKTITKVRGLSSSTASSTQGNVSHSQQGSHWQ